MTNLPGSETCPSFILFNWFIQSINPQVAEEMLYINY
jgi:hypothetical protein